MFCTGTHVDVIDDASPTGNDEFLAIDVFDTIDATVEPSDDWFRHISLSPLVKNTFGDKVKIVPMAKYAVRVFEVVDEY